MKLIDLHVEEFVKQVGEGTPAPGGGSVAALAGGLGAALCMMTAGLTLGKEKYRGVWPKMQAITELSGAVAARSLDLVDQDTDAYGDVLLAFKLPNNTPELSAARRESIQEATRNATLIPLETLREMAKLTRAAEAAIEEGNPNCLSDTAVGVQLIRAAAMGAAYNVRINLSSIADKAFASGMESEMKSLRDEILQAVGKLEGRIEELMAG